jgi:hypothetical protein
VFGADGHSFFLFFGKNVVFISAVGI